MDSVVCFLFHRIVIYPVHGVIQPLNSLVQETQNEVRMNLADKVVSCCQNELKGSLKSYAYVSVVNTRLNGPVTYRRIFFRMVNIEPELIPVSVA